MEEIKPIKLSADNGETKIEITLLGDSDIFNTIEQVATLLQGIGFLQSTVFEGMESYIENYKDIKSVEE